MSKVKPYNVEDSEKLPVAAEPVVVYETHISHMQALRNRIVEAVNRTNDEMRLVECLETLCTTNNLAYIRMKNSKCCYKKL